MMNAYEQKMCEHQGNLFEISASHFSCGSAFFISRFMHSELAKSLDNIDDPYNFVSPNNMVTIMSQLYPSLNIEKGQKYPPKTMRWIGEVYRAFNIIKKRYSSKIYKILKAEKLLALYDSFHTFSLEYCVDRLEEIVNESTITLSDTEIFRKIMETK